MKTLIISAALLAGAWGLLAQDGSTEAPVPEKLKPAMKAYDLGLDMAKAKRPDAALAAYRDAMQAAEQASDPQAKVVLSSAANNAGAILLVQGRAEEAEAMFRKAVAADPKHALALNNLSAALLKQGKTEEAIAVLKQAIKADAKQGMALNNLARMLIHARDYELAAKTLRASLSLNPENTRETLMLAALAYEKAGVADVEQDKIWKVLLATTDGKPATQLELLKEMVKVGMREQPERILTGILAGKADWVEAKVMLAQLQVLKGKNDLALRSFLDLIPLLPKDVTVRRNAIALLLQAGKTDDAEKLVRDALKEFPKAAVFWFELGRVEEKRGQNLEAEKAYYEAVRIDASMADAWNNLGALVSKRNDVKTTLVCYNNALKADKNHATAKYNLARTLVLSKADIKLGLQLMGAVASGESDVAPMAKKFIDDMAMIAEGGDPLKNNVK